MKSKNCVFLVAATALMIGCSRGPTAIPSLKVNAKAASNRALELHDANGDGELDAEELKTSPGLEYAAKRADTNSDVALSRDELMAIFEAWNAKSIGLLTLRCNITLNKRPLRGAKVRLEPEPLLDGQVETAIGLTDEFGDAFLTVPKDKRPIADAPPGVQIGLYRVVISKIDNGKEIVPAKYNTETTLGQEVSFDDPGVLNGVEFRLRK